MDSGVDEELNYEEDEPENDESSKDSENRECTEESVTNNSNLESDDQYLQIDYLEDENLTNDPPESVTTASENDGKGDFTVEKNENSNQENVETVQEDLNPLKKSGDSGDNAGNVTNRKKRVRQFHRRTEFRKKLTNALSLNPWLPEYNFLYRHRQQAAQFVNRNPMLNAKQDFYRIPSSPLAQLMPNSKGYPQSPSARLGTEVSGQSFPQLSNNLTAKLLGQTFKDDSSGYLVENGQVELSRSFGYNGMKTDIFSKGCGNSNSSGFDQNKNLNKITQPYSSDFKSNNSTKNGCKTVCYNGKSNQVGADLGNLESKHFPVKSEDGFVNNVQFRPFQEEEKKVLMMKKEARLKRFMQDDIKKDKLTDSGFEGSPQYGSPPKVPLLEKKGKKFITGEQQKNFVSCNEREGPPEKPDINKELLLRKKNPFSGSVGTSSFSLSNKANQNVNIDGVKVESVDTEACMTTYTWPRAPPMKMEAREGQSFLPIKTETQPQVKFIRTISKSFDELTFKKPRTEVPEPQGNLFPFAGQKIGESFPKQLEPQLTGCIVKVLNIPPSTTTNDILALCSPIGIVMEVKLNCPKENSVVIRFSEPKFAEKFFSLYHGQKMNNYFLNVIVV